MESIKKLKRIEIILKKYRAGKETARMIFVVVLISAKQTERTSKFNT